MAGHERETKRVRGDTAEAKAFHAMLLRLRADGASNRETAEAVMRSPFVLWLVRVVTAKNGVRVGRRAWTPDNWWECLEREPQLRDEWGSETLAILGRRLRARGDDRCDLSRPDIGGYWRVKVAYAAVKAAHTLHREGRLRVRGARTEVPGGDAGAHLPPGQEGRQAGVAGVLCYGDAGEYLAGGELTTGECDLALDLKAAIDGLGNARQREVLRLSLLGHTYQEIADRLTTAGGRDGGTVTYEMVRGAFERARDVLRDRLASPAA